MVVDRNEPGPWPVKVKLHEVQRGASTRRLEADEARRRLIARAFDLPAVKRLEAEVRVAPWLDGAEITADWRAEITQTCGVSLEPFDSALAGAFRVRVVPPDSEAAASPDSEISLDPDAEDPPDVLEGDAIDLGAYLLEYFGLEIDPFARKPGVEWEPPPPESPASPFAVLQRLKREEGEGA